MKKSSLMMAAAAVATAAALLSGCGGGGDNQSPTSAVPVTAVTSIGGWISYLQALVASSADTLEPVDISTVVPPTDETSSPSTVD